MGGSTSTRPFTDLENARRFAKEHADSVRYVATSRRWYTWDGTRWEPDRMAEVQRRAKETARGLEAKAKKVADYEERKKHLRYAMSAQSAHRINGMIELAKSEPGIVLSPDQL